MPGSVLVVTSYVLLGIFLAAFLVRVFRMLRVPVHLRWELAPVPHEKGRGRYGGSYYEVFEWWTKPREKSLVNELIYMFLEIVFLKSVWEHNRRLWWFSFPLHFGLYLSIVAAGLLLLSGLLGLTAAPQSWSEILGKGTFVLCTTGYALGGIGALGLLVSRICDPRLRAFATRVSLFNLALLAAMFASGCCALAVSGDFAAETSQFVGALLGADTAVETPGVLAVHLVLIFVFLAYLPFSQMMHFVAKYFTYHEVRWDDEPLDPGGRTEAKVLELLKQSPTWSGPHLKTDGRKNWVDIATEETTK